MVKINVTNPEEEVKAEITEIVEKERQLIAMEVALSQNEQFKQFLAFQKEVKAQADTFWKKVEEQMIEHDIKTVKGDWGTVTIVERLGFDVDETELPRKYFKRVVDTTKLAQDYKLTDIAPRGATPKVTKFIRKTIK